MRAKLERIQVNEFKRIGALTIDLKPITALVGGNTSGKSSALQAAQLGVSVLQAAHRGTKASGLPDFVGTIANDAVLFRPTENLLDLRRGRSATQKLGYEIIYTATDLDTNARKVVLVRVRRGKNANLWVEIEGDLDFAAVLADRDRPFCVLTPGLSGISLREEWRTRGAMDAAVMHGDANLYLRTVLDHLFRHDLDLPAIEAWKARRDILALPEGRWKRFCSLLERCYPGARIIVEHDERPQRYVHVVAEYGGSSVTLEMASTGMLQVVQILAYACFYEPPLLLLDEPDAHLHADSQAKLYEALKGLAAETDTRVLFASHSPQLIQRLMFDGDATVIWLSDGAAVPLDEARRPALPILMTLGALTSGADVFDPARRMILLTEDKVQGPVLTVARASGGEDVACLSYNGCGNLPGARLLARIITDLRDDATVFIHRDRDFRTDAELVFEAAIFAAYKEQEELDRVHEIFTPLNDVEQLFAQPAHLKTVLVGRLGDAEIDAIVADCIARKRDDLIHATRKARSVIADTTYASGRLRRKPAWAASRMPARAPDDATFLPIDGLHPVAFEMCHGKMILTAVRHAVHGALGGNSMELESIINGPSPAIEVAAWRAVFAAAR